MNFYIQYITSRYNSKMYTGTYIKYSTVLHKKENKRIIVDSSNPIYRLIQDLDIGKFDLDNIKFICKVIVLYIEIENDHDFIKKESDYVYSLNYESDIIIISKCLVNSNSISESEDIKRIEFESLKSYVEMYNF